MKQALHIFRKDIRFLRYEILGMLFLAGAFAAGAVWLSDILALVALYVVARLIHAEAIPGDRQFWLTRPYRPMSLCAAKLLFIVVFICVPLGLAQAALAVRLGFPFAYEIPGLLWSQVLMFFVAGLPVVALATVTASIIPFLSTVLVLAVITLMGVHGLPGVLQGHVPIVPLAFGWIGDSVFGAAISCLATIVILWQYRDRRTLFSRVFGVVAFYLVIAAWLWMPARWPLAVQAWFSKEPGLAAPVTVSVDMKRRRETANSGQIPVPVVLNGLPAGVEARADDFRVSFEWPGHVLNPGRRAGITAHSTSQGEAEIDALVRIEPQEYYAVRKTPMTARGSVFVTLFGAPESRTIPLRNGRVNAQDGLRCWADDFKGEITQTYCQSFFSWPSRLVYIRGGGAESDFSNSLVSYSPFPAGLTLEPLDTRWAEGIKADQATIITKRPLAHFRREFELKGVRLADFEKMPTAPPAPGQFAR